MNLNVARGRDQFAKHKKAILFISNLYSIFPLKIRMRIFEHHRKTGGKLGLGIRYALIKSIAQVCGDNVAIYSDVYLLNPQNLSIGSNVSIHPMCYIECGNCHTIGVAIDNDVSIAHGCTIMATTHSYSQSNVKIKDQPVLTKPVYIHENVWIGAKSTILAGITVENDCVIGANAVVTKRTEAGGVYVGVPAKLIKKRGNIDYENSNIDSNI